MVIKRFEDIFAWQKAGKLTLEIYRQFYLSKDFSFRDQIRRASISVMNNIAEGFERRTNKEFKNFLYIAEGSCGEVRSMLYIAFRLGYINKEQFKSFHEITIEISRMLSGLIKSLK